MGGRASTEKMVAAIKQVNHFFLLVVSQAATLKVGKYLYFNQEKHALGGRTELSRAQPTRK
jgi:hypothetical protein